ncbi:unnamed protein product [Caenorhabditis sp. 36 PRJEB53466]|nr:unnamed protein product [Caenorhabditis sp. 36 PRJEB53466]
MLEEDSDAAASAFGVFRLAHPKHGTTYRPRLFNEAAAKLSAEEFAKLYAQLFTDLINKKTPEAYQAHNPYLDVELLFFECYAQTAENYKMFRKWLEQFVLFHSDPKITINSARGDASSAEFQLHIDVKTRMGPRMVFDMKYSATLEESGWKILFINRDIGCT